MNKRNMLRMFISILAASSLSLTGCAVRREAGGISLSEDSTAVAEESIDKINISLLPYSFYFTVITLEFSSSP